MKNRDLLDHIDKQAVVAAIDLAEKDCSGEIRVHVEPKLRGRQIEDVAARTFERLGMTKTKLRNGVLLFIASEEQRFMILGDQAINDIVGHDFWDSIASQLGEHFRAGEFTTGITEAVARVGQQLKDHFPFMTGDRNELANEVSVGHHDETR